MTDLAARLREVIEERLRVAREATPGPWDYQATSLHMDGTGTYRIAPLGAPQVLTSWMRGVDPQHIALNDPADAILAGERDLGVLERHKPLDDTGLSGLRCRSCYPIIDLVAEWPCTEWRALAKRYGVTE